MFIESAVTSGVVSDLQAIKVEEQKLKAVKQALREAEKLYAWEATTKAVNPQYMVGSRRQATDDDLAVLENTHGVVCVITCRECGAERIVNVQDAKQTQLCKACKEKANRVKDQIRRANKRLAGKTKEQLEQEIAATQAQLETLKAAVG